MCHALHIFFFRVYISFVFAPNSSVRFSFIFISFIVINVLLSANSKNRYIWIFSCCVLCCLLPIRNRFVFNSPLLLYVIFERMKRFVFIFLLHSLNMSRNDAFKWWTFYCIAQQWRWWWRGDVVHSFQPFAICNWWKNNKM